MRGHPGTEVRKGSGIRSQSKEQRTGRRCEFSSLRFHQTSPHFNLQFHVLIVLGYTLAIPMGDDSSIHLVLAVHCSHGLLR